jgi:hypothetical protein
MADPTRESVKSPDRPGLSGRADTRAERGPGGFSHPDEIPASTLYVVVSKGRLKHGEREEPRRSTKPCDKPNRAARNSIITAVHTRYPADFERPTHAVFVVLRGSSCLSLADGDARMEPTGSTEAPNSPHSIRRQVSSSTRLHRPPHPMTLFRPSEISRPSHTEGSSCL